jgi:hypothetical protein
LFGCFNFFMLMFYVLSFGLCVAGGKAAAPSPWSLLRTRLLLPVWHQQHAALLALQGLIGIIVYKHGAGQIQALPCKWLDGVPLVPTLSRLPLQVWGGAVRCVRKQT